MIACARDRVLRYLAPVLIALLAMAALSGCEGEEAPASGVYTEMLRLVPDEPEARRWVKMGDFARFVEVAGVEASAEVAPREYLGALAEAAPDVPFPGLVFLFGSYTQEPVVAEHMERYLGIALRDVDQWMQVGEVPPRERFVVRGSFDPDAVDDLLAGCPECPEAERIDHRGTTIYAWSDDFSQDLSARLSPPAFDELGRGCCIAVQDGYALRAVWREGVTSMLDAQAGEVSLADDDDFRLAAEGLDHLGTLGAFLSAETQEATRPGDLTGAYEGNPRFDRMQEAWAPGPDATLLRPYSVIGIGPGYEDGERFTGVVLVHESDDDARENADRLGPRVEEALVIFQQGGAPDRWGEVYERVEVEVDGRVLRAKLWGRSAWDGLLSRREPLFLHE